MDRTGKILIPGISEAVASVTDDELELYDKIDFDLEEYKIGRASCRERVSSPV